MSDTAIQLRNIARVLRKGFAGHLAFDSAECQGMAKSLTTAADELERLTAAVERVRALHNCVDSVTWSNNCCDNCLVDFPCPTLRALDGAP